MLIPLLLIIPGMMLSGCGNSGTGRAEAENSPEHEHGHDHEVAGDGHSLHGWWCAEHGVPEEVCTRCTPKLASTFREKNDWCDEHNLPDSHCFICHPELQEKFAAQYEAKFGSKPPAPTE